MTLQTRIERLTAWRQSEAETFTRTLEDRLAAQVPDLDAERAGAVVAEWCAGDSTLEARWLTAYRILGAMDADGYPAGGHGFETAKPHRTRENVREEPL